MHSNAPLWQHDVMSDEAPFSGQSGRLTLHIIGQILKLSAQGSISKQVANPTINIDP